VQAALHPGTPAQPRIQPRYRVPPEARPQVHRGAAAPARQGPLRQGSRSCRARGRPPKDAAVRTAQRTPSWSRLPELNGACRVRLTTCATAASGEPPAHTISTFLCRQPHLPPERSPSGRACRLHARLGGAMSRKLFPADGDPQKPKPKGSQETDDTAGSPDQPPEQDVIKRQR
jgi:hypothetical protein